MPKAAAHFPALDSLRGLAILMVICHNGLIMERPNPPFAEGWVHYILNEGWVGVLLFFVLSGFLITGILLDSVDKPHAMRHFLVRRALRIFPLYYGFLLLTFVVLPIVGMQPTSYAAQAPHQIWLWTYLDNWSNALGSHPDALPHFWSLSVEEQFYLMWPWLVIGLRTPSRVAIACLVVAAIGVASRVAALGAGLEPDAVYEMTTSRLDALALGGLAAACWRIPTWAHWVRINAVKMAWAVLALLAGSALLTHGFPRTTFLGMVWGYLVLAVGFAFVIYLSAWHDSHVGALRQSWCGTRP
jgi:peptidoglycan/LPS O-acetylase OafA/YrhL